HRTQNDPYRPRRSTQRREVLAAARAIRRADQNRQLRLHHVASRASVGAHRRRAGPVRRDSRFARGRERRSRWRACLSWHAARGGARVWGPSASFEGQRVGRDHVRRTPSPTLCSWRPSTWRPTRSRGKAHPAYACESAPPQCPAPGRVDRMGADSFGLVLTLWTYVSWTTTTSARSSRRPGSSSAGYRPWSCGRSAVTSAQAEGWVAVRYQEEGIGAYTQGPTSEADDEIE